MAEPLFHREPTRREAPARVLAASPEGVLLDDPLFYATSGGQPGDSGHLLWAGGRLEVTDAVKGEGGTVLLRPGEGALPPVGAELTQVLDWERRHAHMRCHTALHLLSVVLPFPVTGGAIAAGKGRLDFDMAEPPDDLPSLEARLNELVARDLPVSAEWVDEAVLDAQPSLVKTLSVAPPRGAGRIRLVRIGSGADSVDLQPCGGTHVARTGEIGPLRLGKLEKKGRQNRRVTILLT